MTRTNLMWALAVALAVGALLGSVAAVQRAEQQDAENALRGNRTFCEAHANVPACQEQTP
jgi:hypothetical protein